MTSITGTAATLANSGAAHAHTAGTSTHGVQLNPPAFNDPRFIRGTTGNFGQNLKIVQENGPGFGGIKAQKNQNNNDKKQNNFGETDANFERTLGVIANPDTGQPMTYLQTMQAYNAAGAVQALFPDAYATLVANQNAGRGTVLGGALYLLGVTRTSDPSVTGISQATTSQMRTAQLPGLGSLRGYVMSPTDLKGREWNRAHHPGSHWTAISGLTKAGFSYQEAALFTGDSMTSWAGRVTGSNNQNGNKNGFADDEMAGLKFLVIAEKATGKDILTSVLGSHSDTHLPTNKLTDPKIFKLLGIDHKKGAPISASEIQAIRQYALNSSTTVNQGQFNKFLKKTPADLRAKMDATGLLNSVQFEQKQNTGGGGGGGTAADVNAGQNVTGLGTGEAPAADAQAGADLGVTGLGGADTPTPTEAGAGAAALTDPQGMAQLMDIQSKLDETEADMSLLTAKLAKSLEDGRITKPERKSLVKGLAGKAKKQLTSAIKEAMKDGKITESEAADLKKAASEAEDMTVKEALKDGKISDKERAQLKEVLTDKQLEKLDKADTDGKVSKKETKEILAADDKAKDSKDTTAVAGEKNSKAKDTTKDGKKDTTKTPKGDHKGGEHKKAA